MGGGGGGGLSSFTDDILSTMETGNLCGTLFLDLSKAFDTVNHRILLNELGKLELVATICDGFSSIRTVIIYGLHVVLNCLILLRVK